MDASSNTSNEAPRRSNRQRLATGLAAALITMAVAAPTAIARPAGPAAGAVFAHLSTTRAASRRVRQPRRRGARARPTGATRRSASAACLRSSRSPAWESIAAGACRLLHGRRRAQTRRIETRSPAPCSPSALSRPFLAMLARRRVGPASTRRHRGSGQGAGGSARSPPENGRRREGEAVRGAAPSRGRRTLCWSWSDPSCARAAEAAPASVDSSGSRVGSVSVGRLGEGDHVPIRIGDIHVADAVRVQARSVRARCRER